MFYYPFYPLHLSVRECVGATDGLPRCHFPDKTNHRIGSGLSRTELFASFKSLTAPISAPFNRTVLEDAILSEGPACEIVGMGESG